MTKADLIEKALLQIVWMNCQHLAVENPLPQGFAEFSGVRKTWHELAMRRARRLVDVYRFPAFRPRAAVRGVFGDPKARVVRLERRGKNCVWSLRSSLAPNLRSQAALGARPVGGRHQNLPGDREPSGALPELRQSEAGEAGMALRQPFLHQALCVLRGPALSGFDDPGRRPRAAPGLENRQEARRAVHAGTAPKSWNTGSAGDRHRRDLDPQGAHLSHRSERPGAAPPDLVRRTGPVRSQPRPLLPVAGSREKQADQARGDGHVETLS